MGLQRLGLINHPYHRGPARYTRGFLYALAGPGGCCSDDVLESRQVAKNNYNEQVYDIMASTRVLKRKSSNKDIEARNRFDSWQNKNIDQNAI